MKSFSSGLPEREYKDTEQILNSPHQQNIPENGLKTWHASFHSPPSAALCVQKPAHHQLGKSHLHKK